MVEGLIMWPAMYDHCPMSKSQKIIVVRLLHEVHVSAPTTL